MKVDLPNLVWTRWRHLVQDSRGPGTKESCLSLCYVCLVVWAAAWLAAMVPHESS